MHADGTFSLCRPRVPVKEGARFALHILMAMQLYRLAIADIDLLLGSFGHERMQDQIITKCRAVPCQYNQLVCAECINRVSRGGGHSANLVEPQS